MNKWQYSVCVTLGVLCVIMSTALIIFTRLNTTMEREIQTRHQKLNNGILGPQAQQIANNILNDMAAVAPHNAKMRALLAKHGYDIPAATAPSTEKAPTTKTKEK